MTTLTSASPTISPSPSFHGRSSRNSLSSLRRHSPSHSASSPASSSKTHISTSSPSFSPTAARRTNSNLNASTIKPATTMETAAIATASPVVKAQTVDVGTQYTPPGYPPTARNLAPPQSQPTSSTAIERPVTTFPLSDPMDTDTTTVTTPSKRREPANDDNDNPAEPPEPDPRIDPQPHSSLVPTASTVANAPRSNEASPSKRAKQSGSVKVLPRKYWECDVQDLGVLIADMLMELVRINDKIPLRDGTLTRFHSRYVWQFSMAL
jgi:hypothetical protein